MALVNMTDMLKKAQAGKYAVANFDACNMEMMMGALRAAEKLNSPVIIAYAKVFEPIAQMEHMTKAFIAAAQDSPVDVALHLDHAADMDFIKRAVDCGFTSIMVDASDHELEDNMAITRTVADLCHPLGISVEAELGHVGGLEGMHTACEDYDAQAYTDVEEAKKFVEGSQCDALAVAIGTVHGVYKGTPCLSFDRLQELRAAIDTPMVLHGGSGLSDDDFRKVVSMGICKVNIFTDLTLQALARFGQGLEEKSDYVPLCRLVEDAIQAEAEKKLLLFGSQDKMAK